MLLLGQIDGYTKTPRGGVWGHSVISEHNLVGAITFLYNYALYILFCSLLRFCPTDFLTALTGSTSTANVCLYVENCPTATSGALWKTRGICLFSYKACSRGVDQQTEGHTGNGSQSKGEQRRTP